MQATRLMNVFLGCIAVMLAVLLFKTTMPGEGAPLISEANAQTPGQQRVVLYVCTVSYGDCSPVPLMADKNGVVQVKVAK